MSKLVLGLGTSHSSQLSLDPEMWGEQGKLDIQRTPYEELLSRAPHFIAEELGVDVWREKHNRAQTALRRLADILMEAAPDIVVVVGDDQEELFLQDCMPAFAVFCGEESWDRPPSAEERARLSPQRKAIQWAIHADVPEAYPGAPAFARHLLEQLIDAGFDPAQVSRQHDHRSLGHAYTFVRRRLMSPEMNVPIVPVFINTYVPPNQPSAARCYRLGQVLREAIESWPAILGSRWSDRAGSAILSSIRSSTAWSWKR